MGVDQLETDLAAAEQAVADIKVTAETMRQELQVQCEQRDATTVQIQRCYLRARRINSIPHR